MARGNLHQTKALCERIMRLFARARDDDDYLYRAVIRRLLKEKGGPKLSEITASEFLMDTVRQYNLPSYDTVTRCRRKIQADHPELRGKYDSHRQARQEIYKAFNREED